MADLNNEILPRNSAVTEPSVVLTLASANISTHIRGSKRSYYKLPLHLRVSLLDVTISGGDVSLGAFTGISCPGWGNYDFVGPLVVNCYTGYEAITPTVETLRSLISNCKVAAPLATVAYICHAFPGVQWQNLIVLPSVSVKMAHHHLEIFGHPQMLGMVRRAIDATTGIPTMTQSASDAALALEGVALRIEKTLFEGDLPPKMIDFLLLLCDLVREAMSPSALGTSVLVIRFLRTFNITHLFSALMPLIESLVSLLTPKYSVGGEGRFEVRGQPQMLGMEVDWSKLSDRVAWQDAIIKCIAPTVGVLVFHSMSTSSKMVDKIVDTCKHINILAPATRHMWALMEYLVQLVPRVVQEWLSEICPTAFIMKCQAGEDIVEWYSSTLLLIQQGAAGQLTYDPIMRQNAKQLHLKAQTFITQVQERLPPVLSGLLSDAYRQLSGLVRGLREDEGELVSRPVPFCVYVTGKPGIGKSVFVNQLVDYMVPETIPAASRVYTRQPTGKFWDGYACQYATKIDDFGQDASGEGALEFMNLVGSVPYMPPMASLDNPAIGVKGTMFVSKLLVISSNVAYPRPKTIIEMAALHRRRHILIEAQETGADYDENFSHLNCRILPSVQGHGKPSEWMSVLDTVKVIMQARQEHERTQQILSAGTFSPLFRAAVAEELTADDVRGAFREILEVHGEPQMDNGCEDEAFHRECVGKKWTAALLRKHDRLHGILDPSSMSLVRWVACGGLDVPDQPSLTRYERSLEYVKHACANMTVEVATFLEKHPWVDILLKSSVLLGGFYLLRKMWPSTPEAKAACAIGAAVRCVVCSSVPGEIQMANPSAGEVSQRKLRRRTVYAPREGQPQAATQERVVVPTDEYLFPTEMSPLEEFAARLEHNHVSVSYTGVVVGDEKHRARMHAFAVGARVLLLPKHFFVAPGQWIPDKTEIAMVARGITYAVPFYRRDIHEFASALPDRERDLCAWRLPRNVPCFPDRRSQFQPQSRVETGDLGEGVLLKFSNNNILTQMISLQSLRMEEIATRYDCGTIKLANLPLYYYDGKMCNVGDCGSVLVLARQPMVIAGMHVAAVACGGRVAGVSEILSKRDLASLEELGWFNEHVERVGIPQLEMRISTLAPEGNFMHQGSLPPRLSIRLPEKTRWRKTSLFDQLSEHVTEPAVLSMRDPRIAPEFRGISPLKKAITKYAIQAGPFNQDDLDQANEVLLTILTGGKRRVLTLDEAINGITGEQYFERLNMQTSPGFGWKSTGKRGKMHLFVEDGQQHLTPVPELERAVLQMEEAAALGVAIPHLWTATLKDERVPLRKIPIAKTRAFSIPQVEETILTRKYFLGFFANMYATHSETPFAVGMDCESGEWDALVRYLVNFQEKSNIRFFDLDYSNFDGKVSGQMLHSFCDLVNQWYDDGPRNARIRRTIMEEMIFSYEVARDAVYQRPGGVPSGWSGTVIVNSIVGFYYLFCAYKDLAPLHICDASSFLAYVRCKIVGDDNVVAIVPQIQEFFHPNALQQWFAQKGVEVTSAADKTQGISFVPLEELSFLKRKFGIVKEVDPHHWVAMLSRNSILEMINWVSDYACEEEALKQNADTSLRFAFFHGKAFHDEIRQFLLKEKPEIGYLSTFAEKRNQYVRGVYRMCDVWVERIGVPQSETHVEGTATYRQDPMHDMTVVEKPTRADTAVIGKINEDPWSLTKLAEKEILLQTIQWDTTVTNGHVLTTITLPQTLDNHTYYNRLFNNVALFRSDFELTIQVNGTRFHQGILLVTWHPLMNHVAVEENADIIDWSFPSLTSLPHVFIDASMSVPQKIFIPWVHYCQYLQISNTYAAPLGTLRFTVLNELSAGTGASTDLGIAVTSRMVNPVFHLPATLNGQKAPDFNQALERWGLPQMDMGVQSVDIGMVSGRAKADTPASHDMWDCVDSVRDVLKRKVCLGTTAFLSTTGQDFERVCIMDAAAILDPMTCSTLQQSWSSCFSLGRGTFRYTFAFSSSPSSGEAPLDYFAMFVPRTGIAFNGSATVAVPKSIFHDFNVVSASKLSALYGDSNVGERPTWRHAAPDPAFSGAVWKPNFALPAMQASGGLGGVINVEVPFTCPGLAYYIPINDHATTKEDAPGFLSQLSTPGVILFGIRGQTPSPFRVTCTVYGSYGDNFRMGAFRGIPKMSIGGYSNTPTVDTSYLSMYPDNWVAAVLPSLSEKKKEKTLPTTTTPAPTTKKSAGATRKKKVKPETTVKPTTMVAPTTALPVTTALPTTTQTILRSAREILGVPQGNHISTSVTNYIKSASNTTLPTNVTGDAIDLKGEYKSTMLDKPSWTMTGLPVFTSSYPVMPNSTGLEPSAMLGMDASAVQANKPEVFGTSFDEMSLTWLRKKLCWVTTFAWNTGDATGDALYHRAVGPLASAVTATPGTLTCHVSPGSEFNATALDTFTAPFNFWTGAMRYRIQISSSGFHTGKLWVAIAYVQGGMASMDDALGQYGFMIDLGEQKREFEFEVPYRSVFPHLNVFNGPQNGLRQVPAFMGSISLYVVNPLVCPEGIVGLVDVNVYEGAGSDFCASCPGGINTTLLGIRPGAII